MSCWSSAMRGTVAICIALCVLCASGSLAAAQSTAQGQAYYGKKLARKVLGIQGAQTVQSTTAIDNTQAIASGNAIDSMKRVEWGSGPVLGGSSRPVQGGSSNAWAGANAQSFNNGRGGNGAAPNAAAGSNSWGRPAGSNSWGPMGGPGASAPSGAGAGAGPSAGGRSPFRGKKKL